jgi:signal transduction histidine kinase
MTREHGGTGLGLAIVKGIVSGIGGKIWVESKENFGTTFYFTIPKKSKN